MKQTVKYLKIFCNLAAFILLLFILGYLLPKVLVFFMPFVIGFLLSLVANPLVRFLEKKLKIKRKYGTFLTIVLVIALLVFACYGTGMLLAVGIRGFMDYLPTMYENAGAELAAAFEKLQSLLHKIPALAQLDVGELSTMLQDALGNLVNDYKKPTFSAISGFATSIPDVLVSVIMGLLATYFFIADRDRLMKALKRHIPASLQEKTMLVYGHMLRAVGGYFKAQLKIMVVIYIVIMLGLMVIGVNYAWLIGFGIAFLDMLPVFGTGTVLIPWAVVKVFSGNIATAAGMIILYAVSLVVHQLIQPKLVGESVGLDPFTTLFFMFIGYKMKGVIGMIIAIPIGMVLTTFYEAGAFDHLIWCIQEVVHDIQEFCKIEKEEKEPL
ncbi:MAG: sporulation integral membrane protein YtvI [Eubacterium sp.]|nr:sporulation integral membrane protein YtvI [Eubacterium sp.]